MTDSVSVLSVLWMSCMRTAQAMPMLFPESLLTIMLSLLCARLGYTMPGKRRGPPAAATKAAAPEKALHWQPKDTEARRQTVAALRKDISDQDFEYRIAWLDHYNDFPPHNDGISCGIANCKHYIKR